MPTTRYYGARNRSYSLFIIFSALSRCAICEMATVKKLQPVCILQGSVRTKVFDGACKRRHSLFSTPSPIVKDSNGVACEALARDARHPSGLERLPTSSLLRNVFLGKFITSPVFFKPGFAVLKKIANSKSIFLNPDSNPLLRALIKPLVYDQFCAGTDQSEICQTKSTIRNMGYSGIILGYGKEIQVTPSNRMRLLQGQNITDESEINEWEKGNLRTLDMIGDGDWLAIKFTGAGSSVTRALMRNENPPLRFGEAMKAICEKARSKNCRVLIDAEQQIVQTAIDRLTINLMRIYNGSSGQALVYNTLQAYLKTSRDKLKRQLALANQERWTLGVKLVRGAYIGNDSRDLIHDTKKDTDDSYNGIVRDLLTGSNLLPHNERPRVALFLAGHNPESIAAAMKLIRDRSPQNNLNVLPDFGQLQGMGDNLGCKILQQNEEHKQSSGVASDSIIVPKVYKYLTWGTIQECMQYLIRRVVENSGGMDRMRDGLSAYSQELKRRALRG